MSNLIQKCLYSSDFTAYNDVKFESERFCDEFIGQNIIKSSIFDVMSKYCKKMDRDFKCLFLPINDSKVWAFTTIIKDCIFVTINTRLPKIKQYFAAAHELYHIKNHIESGDDSLLENGSLLTENETAFQTETEEDKKANAFAGIILAPENMIQNQKLIGPDISDGLRYVLFFCERFGLPFKAMILRLYECGILDSKNSDLLLEKENEFYDMALIESVTPEIYASSSENNIEQIAGLVRRNLEQGFITKEKADYDTEKLNAILKEIKG